jgi:hypothetical protein
MGPFVFAIQVLREENSTEQKTTNRTNLDINLFIFCLNDVFLGSAFMFSEALAVMLK